MSDRLAETVVAECENMCESGDVKGATLTVTFESGVTREVRIGEGATHPETPSGEGSGASESMNVPEGAVGCEACGEIFAHDTLKSSKSAFHGHKNGDCDGGRGPVMPGDTLEAGEASESDESESEPTPASDMNKQARGDLREAFEENPEEEHERVMRRLKAAEDYVAFAGACPFCDESHGGRKMGRAVTPEGVLDYCQSHANAIDALSDDNREAFEAMRDSKGHAKALELAQA